MHDDGYEKKPLGDIHVVEAMSITWKNSLQVIREQPVFKYFLVTAFIIGIFEMWGWYAWQPVRQAYIHKIIPSSERATAISFDALVGSLGGVVGQPSLGYVARTFSVPFGYRVSSIIILSILPWILKIRKEGHEADNL